MSNQKSLSDLQMNISLNKDNSSVEKELTEILNNTELKGELEKKNPLIEFIGKKGAKLKDSRIQYSYTNIQTKWKEFRKEEDKIYLFRITRLIDAKTKGLIKKEFEIHKKNEDLNNISPEFICYYCSKFLNFSVFVVTEYFTLKELLENHKLPSFSNKDSFIIFSKTELLVSCLETIKIDGSAHVIKAPKANENTITMKRFCCLDKEPPINSPTLDKPVEAPIWKRAKPNIKTTPPIIKVM